MVDTGPRFFIGAATGVVSSELLVRHATLPPWGAAATVSALALLVMSMKRKNSHEIATGMIVGALGDWAWRSSQSGYPDFLVGSP